MHPSKFKRKRTLSSGTRKKTAVRTPEQLHPDLVEQRLIKRLEAGDENVYAQLLQLYLPFVISIVQKYHAYFPWLDFKELLEEANFGLLQAMKHYRSSKNTKFSSYAWFWIIKAVQEYITQNIDFFKIPYQIKKRFKKINKQIEKEISTRGIPSLELIAKKLRCEPDKVRELLGEQSTTRLPLSLDQNIDGEEEKSTLKDIIADAEPDHEDVLVKREDDDQLNAFLGQLSPLEAEVIQWRFGFKDSKFHSLKEIGRKLNITAQKTRDLEIMALLKLKRVVNK